MVLLGHFASVEEAIEWARLNHPDTNLFVDGEFIEPTANEWADGDEDYQTVRIGK